MIEVREALRRLCDQARPLDVVEVDLDDALGLVLAEPVAADRDFPPTDRSAMDGFAVRSADLAAGRILRVAGEMRAGASGAGLRVEPGAAVRIMTGAVIPQGADAVVMVERTLVGPGADRITVDDRPAPGQHIRRRGEDVLRGETVLEPGRAIHAPEAAVLAAVGKVRPRVHRPPVVHVLSTGDEVVEPGTAPADHEVRNSNSITLLAQLRELGLGGRALGLAPDERARLDPLIEAGLAGDVLLVTGGVSVGDYDLVGQALADAGMELVFHKVAVKPGKPILAGRRGSCLVIGLPGNPVSAYTGFAVLVAPALRRMMGYLAWRNVELAATLERPLRADPKRTVYHLARIAAGPGGLSAAPVESRGSGDVISLARANGFLVTAAGGGELPSGASVPALAWRDFHLR